MKSGFLYVLTHPSEPKLYKIGVTVLRPEQRLAQHNSQTEKHAGKVVERTGQKWELKTCIPVADPYWAERAFWQATQYSVIPYQGGIEVQRMEWQEVLDGLEAAKNAGVGPPVSKPRRNREWMIELLEGTPIKMIGRYRGLVAFVEFECVSGHVFREAPAWVENHKLCPLCKSQGTGKK